MARTNSSKDNQERILIYYRTKMPNRANTLNEKKEVIERLLKLWLDNPELRLAQLIGNVKRNPIYYQEDFPFIKELEEFYNNKEAQNEQ